MKTKPKTKMKRLLAMLTCIAMIVTMMPMLGIGNYEAHADSSTTIETISGGTYTFDEGNSHTCYVFNGNTTITLNGNHTINITDTKDKSATGLWGDGTLTIGGSGILNINITPVVQHQQQQKKQTQIFQLIPQQVMFLSLMKV